MRLECKLLDSLVHFVYTERYIKCARGGLIGFLNKPGVGPWQWWGNSGVQVLRVRGDTDHVQAWIFVAFGIKHAARLRMLCD